MGVVLYCIKIRKKLLIYLVIKYINNKYNIKCIGSIIILLVVTYFISVTFVTKGFPQYALDSWIHYEWSHHFADQFWQGELYPRWLADKNGGLGSPAFYFYPPVPYFITSILKIISPNIENCSRTLGISVAAGIILSAIFFFKLMRRYTSESIAALSSACYLLIPYHLNEDIYSRSAFAEFWAMTWLPLIFYYTDKILYDNKQSIIKLSYAYALLIMSHLPTTLIASPFIVFYSLALSKKYEKSKYFIRVVYGMVLGIGISAMYLIPALTLQWAVSMNELTDSHFYYGYHFFFTDNEIKNDYEKGLLLPICSMEIAGITSALLYILSSKNKFNKIILFWLFVTLFCFFMMTPISDPIWKIFWVLQIIQFPFRYGTVLSLSVAILIGLAMTKINEINSIIIAIIAILIWAFVVIWLYLALVSLWKHFSNSVDITLPVIQREVPEYRPRWASKDLEINLKRFISDDDTIRKIVSINDNHLYFIEKWTSRYMIINLLLTNSDTVYIARYYFPGINVKVNGKEYPYNISNPEGVIKLNLNQGRYRIEIAHNMTVQEKAGYLVTLISFILSVLMYYKESRIKCLM
ncbi:MAG: 6-pyruvoyl-tetrahydropterin synthase-related protein [Verrucomicrobiia bacterium]